MTRAERAKERRLARARTALASLSKDERRALFKESGECNCIAIAKVIGESPRFVVGAILGGLAAELLGAVPSSTKKIAGGGA